jgi:hypothetical protein
VEFVENLARRAERVDLARGIAAEAAARSSGGGDMAGTSASGAGEEAPPGGAGWYRRPAPREEGAHDAGSQANYLLHLRGPRIR